MESLDSILVSWLEATFDGETATELLNHQCTGDCECLNEPIHYNAKGHGYCITHWDFTQDQEDLAA